jgi:UPF0716 protein FxsA
MKFRILLALFILIPALEITGFLMMDNWIGGWNTFILMLLSGFVGSYLAKREGIKVLQTVQMELSQGRMPGNAVIDGLCVFVGGILLVTPGFFTDVIGLLLILPFTRFFFRGLFVLFVKKWIQNRQTTFYYRQ